MFSVKEFIFVLVNIYFLAFSNAAINDKYGPYHISINNMTRCNGAKPRVKSNILVTMKTFSNGSQEISANAMVYDTIGPLGFRIKISVKDNNGKFTTMVNYRIVNGCEHFLMGPIMKLVPGLSSDCYMQKVQSRLVAGDADTLTHLWFGNSFFYGTYASHVQMLTPHEQVLCIITHFNIIKRTL